ncbi:hypothetical protein GQ55_2G219600 [Panicum hallii var. hallii]|uniref:Uncharacterized protein n=1 Tax=Panicum hallii var. hallii TaxID=1504633 RepID=A0A2T7ER80_9POAL|nr:hypothetical protein GQ55_2G219600 [Panicum hallii var. hallii]
MRMQMWLLGTAGVVSSWEILSWRLESTDMLSREDAELCDCLEEPAELIFLSVFFMGFHIMPTKD